MAADISYGDGCYSSQIGQASNLEDEFASKASLLAGGENFRPIAKDAEDSMEEEDSDDLIIYQYSSEENDGFQGTFEETFTRSVVKEGQEVELPANLWHICLKVGPPEGCNPITYHLNLLKQVVGSDADEVYAEAFSDTTLAAILTDEEHEILSGLEQVESSAIAKGFIEFH